MSLHDPDLVRVALVPLGLLGQRLERVLGRRRGQGPLQRVGMFVPVVVHGDLLAVAQRVEHDPDEEQERCEGQERAPAGDVVPVGECLGVVDVAARHALTAQEVLREEGQVGADEEHPEVQLACPFGVLPARHLADPVVDAREDAEHRAKRHHVVEVRHDVVGVVIGPVDARLRQDDAGHAAQREQEQEPERPEHRRLELDRAAPHRRDPTEDLDAGGHRDHHRRQHEIGLLGQRHADRVHVVRPDDKAQRADGDQRPDHRQVAEDRLFRRRSR